MLKRELFVQELYKLRDFPNENSTCDKILATFNIWAAKLDTSYLNTPTGIHGIGHANRVLFLSILLSELYNLSDKDKELIFTSAIFHDIGRINQDINAIHGELSYRKMHQLALLSPQSLGCEDDNVLKYIMENHCKSDKKIYNQTGQYGIRDGNRAVFLLKLFKDCDGLDRVRLGDLDINYLRNEKSKKLVDIAYLLLLHTKSP